MANVYPLDPVIRLIEPGTRQLAGGQKIVMIDTRRRAAVAKRPWWDGGIRDYLVGNHSDARHVGTGTVTAHQLQDLEHAVAISVKYDVRCPAGDEERAAVALSDAVELPGTMLNGYLKRWLAEMSRAGVAAFVDAYFQNRRTLEAELSSRALEHLGLQMNVRLSLDAERTLNRIDVHDERLVTVSDYHDEEQYLEFRVGVEVDPENRTRAVLQCHRYDEIHTIVPAEIERFIRQHVDLQTFCTRLNGAAAVRQPLIRHLDGVLSEFGRKIGTLTLAADTPGPALELHLQDEVNVLCRPAQYPRAVTINNKVQMNLIDVGRYRAAKSPSLKEWLRTNLDRFVRERLFEARYIDLLLHFGPLEQEIKQTLSERAAEIGYELKQFVTVPDLEPIKWRSRFTVELDGEFPTQRSDVKVKLQLIAVVRIPHLEDIEDLLNQDQHVPTLMQQSMRDRVTQYLHNITPQRYYERFDFTDVPGEVTVETAICEALRQELARLYHAHVISVTVKPIETEPTIRLKALQKQIRDLVIEVPTLHENVPLNFYAKLQIEGIDKTTPDAAGWSRFESRPAGIEEIHKHLEDHLRAELQTVPVNEILFRLPHEQKRLAVRLEKCAMQYASEQFGLAISLNSISRDPTPDEKLAIQDETDLRLAPLQRAVADRERGRRLYQLINDEREAQLMKLLQERTRLTAQEGTEDEIAELDAKIAKAQSRVAKAMIPSAAAVKAQLLRDDPETSVAPGHLLAGAAVTGAPEGGAE